MENSKNNLNVIFIFPYSLKQGSGHLIRQLRFIKIIGDKLPNRKTWINIAPNPLLRDSFFFEQYYEIEANRLIDEIMKFQDKHKKNVFIVDAWNKSLWKDKSNYLELLKNLKENGFLIVFDDINVKEVPSDIGIFPSLEALLKLNEIKKRNLESKIALVGPQYYFVDTNPIEREREEILNSVKNCEKIIITLGGTDPKNLTPVVLEAINIFVTLYKKCLFVTVINSSVIQKESYRFKLNLIKWTNGLPELMRIHDLGIISGGLTKYDAAYAGLPIIMIPQNEEQKASIDVFRSYGYGIPIYFEDKNRLKEQIIKKLSILLTDNHIKNKMISKGKKLQVGSRIFEVKEIIDYKLTKLNR